MQERGAQRVRILWQMVLLTFFGVSSAFGMVVDNRFFGDSFGRRPFMAPDTVTSLQVQPFFLTADQAFDRYGNEVGLFAYGNVPYGIRRLDTALLKAGTTQHSLVRSDWQGRLTNGPYIVGGVLDAYGAVISFFHPFTDNVGFGFRSAALKLNTCFKLVRDYKDFESVIAGVGDEFDLQTLQENVHDALGIRSMFASVYTLADTELYIRLFTVHDYEYLCRLIDAGLSLGVVAPTAKERCIANPASISAGGDGHWGLYLEGNLDAILKQDLRASILVRAQKRFKRTQDQRMPVEDEPTRFGALIGPAEVDPGFTLLVSPYVMFEHIRDGFGLYLGYSLVKHWCDTWTDMRSDKHVPALLNVLEAESVWASERVHCGIFYDLDLGSREYRFNPIISLNVDVPVAWTIAERSAATYGVSLGVEMHF